MIKYKAYIVKIDENLETATHCIALEKRKNKGVEHFHNAIQQYDAVDNN